MSATSRSIRETGKVTILRYTAVQDVGRAIHPSYVEGQIQGGATQGIGWALNEEYIYDAKGLLQNAGFLDYRVPVASDLPMIDAVLVEVPNPQAPFGVRGVGEVPIIPPLAAVANAIRAAIGMRMHSLPMSPPKIRAALDAAQRAEMPHVVIIGLGLPPVHRRPDRVRGDGHQLPPADRRTRRRAFPASAIRSRTGWRSRSTA